MKISIIMLTVGEWMDTFTGIFYLPEVNSTIESENWQKEKLEKQSDAVKSLNFFEFGGKCSKYVDFSPKCMAYYLLNRTLHRIFFFLLSLTEHTNSSCWLHVKQKSMLLKNFHEFWISMMKITLVHRENWTKERKRTVSTSVEFYSNRYKTSESINISKKSIGMTTFLIRKLALTSVSFTEETL